MTIQEIIDMGSFFQTNEDKTKIYVLPLSKFSYAVYPVGTRQVVEVDGKPVERFVPSDKAVAITAEEFEGLTKKQKCWEKGKLVDYMKSDVVIKAEQLLENVESAEKEIVEAKAWLSSKDYIGVKIAQAMLVNDTDEIASLKEQYTQVIDTAKYKRNRINAREAWLKENAEAIEQAKELLEKEK